VSVAPTRSRNASDAGAELSERVPDVGLHDSGQANLFDYLSGVPRLIVAHLAATWSKLEFLAARKHPEIFGIACDKGSEQVLGSERTGSEGSSRSSATLRHLG
jgi:hypothetical protein